mgnify:FL=1
MKFTKLFISFALIASVALSASSCAQSGKVQSETDSAEPKQTESVTLEQQNSGEKQEKLYFPEKNDKTNKALAEMIPEQMSSSVAEMMQKSDIVIVARVIRDDEQWLSEPSGLQNSRSVVTVEEVWKGDAAVGDSVSVYETGWRYEDHDYSIGGEPILRKDMRVVLFLTGVYEGDRSVCGSYQGKIFLDENETAYPFSYYTVGQEGYGPFTDMPQPMALSELRNLLGVNR